MKLKIFGLFSMIAGILTLVSLALPYATTKLLGYDTGNTLNAFDLRSTLADIGGDTLNNLAEYGVYVILAFGILALLAGLLPLFGEFKNSFLINLLCGAIIIAFAAIIIVRVGDLQSEIIGTGFYVGYGLYIAIAGGVMCIISAIISLFKPDMAIGNRNLSNGAQRPSPYFARKRNRPDSARCPMNSSSVSSRMLLTSSLSCLWIRLRMLLLWTCSPRRILMNVPSAP